MVGCVNDRKRTRGGEFFLGNKLVYWHNKKQDYVTLSTAKAEYIAIASCCTQLLWMKKTLNDIKVEYEKPIPILCDNTSDINISNNLVMHSKMKHIAIKYHYLIKRLQIKKFG